jgi:hypothetical protein
MGEVEGMDFHAALAEYRRARNDAGGVIFDRVWSGPAVPAASSDRPLILPLQVSCRVAANSGLGPRPCENRVGGAQLGV